MMKIDAVITWVDGDDPRHKAKRMSYGPAGIFKKDDVAGDTRFSSLGEIFWCVASLNRFAPWINKIYIVTDGQDPCLEDFIAKEFPDRHIPMEIIDHKVIFRGYEEYLPTFNSVSIETMTWRIPGLSDHFIELNDDFMLCAPATPGDFFSPDGKPVCYAGRNITALTRLTRMLKNRKDGTKKVTFKELMVNGADTAGKSIFYFRLEHTPRALSRKFYEETFSSRPDLMKRNISCRFRDVSQFTPQEMQYMSLYKKGDCIHRNPEKILFFLQPKKKKGYVLKKMEKLEKMKSCKFVCFNSIDLACPQDRELVTSWIEKCIGISLSK